MRILVLTSTFPRWAGDREPPFVFELCRRLAARHEVLVIAPHCPEAAAAERLGERLSVRRFRYAPQGLESLAYEGGILEKLRRAPWRHALIPAFLAGELLAAWRAIRDHRPDVIHAHWMIPQGLVALLARAAAGSGRIPFVCTSHGADLFALRGMLASRLKARVARAAAALTVVSAAMKTRAVLLGAAADKVQVMPMGVDARERFVPDARVPREGREVLFVGRLVEKKGVVHLLRAFALVKQAVAAAHLTVIGAGPLEPELRATASDLGIAGAVTFRGAVDNAALADHYRRAALLVMPSIVARDGDQEGLGLVVAEALACECPVVASDLPAVRDVIRDGATGLLAHEADPPDLADKMLAVLRDPVHARDLARRGRELVLERLDWSSVAHGYEALLCAVGGRPL